MEIVVTYRRTSRLSVRIGKQGEVRVSAPYGLPKAEVQRFIENHCEWIENAVARIQVLQKKSDEFFGQLSLKPRKERAAAVERLNAIIVPLVEKYSTEMNVMPSHIDYRATISRWGCCNVKTHVIQFSLYLLLLPEWCIESVVVHELAHLIVPNHSAQFYVVLNKHFPRWHEAKQEIKRISRMEVEE